MAKNKEDKQEVEDDRTCVERILEDGLANGESDLVEAIRELNERVENIEGMRARVPAASSAKKRSGR